jgi:hypothetical protein
VNPAQYPGVAIGVPAGVIDTVTVADPVIPSVAADIVADPAPAAVTRPEELTDATPPFDVDHANVLPEIADPSADFAVAESCAVAPTEVSADDPGVTLTEVTVGVPGVPGSGSEGSAAPSFPQADENKYNRHASPRNAESTRARAAIETAGGNPARHAANMTPSGFG